MACAVADWPTIGVSADARRKWPAADCDFSHYDLAVILLLFKIPEAVRLVCATLRHVRPISYAIRARVAYDMGQMWRVVAQVYWYPPYVGRTRAPKKPRRPRPPSRW